jgi:hypothetical protein
VFRRGFEDQPYSPGERATDNYYHIAKKLTMV